MSLDGFLSQHPDLEKDVAAGAIELGFALLIHEYVVNEKGLASLSIEHNPTIQGGRPVFVDSRTLVFDLGEWLRSGKSLTNFLERNSDVTESIAKCCVELSFGVLCFEHAEGVTSHRS